MSTINPFLNQNNVNANSEVLYVLASTTLTASQSSSIIGIGSAGANIVITLPPLQSGLNFKFYIATTAGTNTVKVLCNASALVLSGIFISWGATSTSSYPVYAVGGTDASFTIADTCKVGDSVDMFCDGTYWYARGISALASATTPFTVGTS